MQENMAALKNKTDAEKLAITENNSDIDSEIEPIPV